MRFGQRLTPAVTWLIAATVACFLVFAFSGAAARATLMRWLVLTPGSLLEGHVWKLATTAFFAVNPLAFILDVAILWMFMPFLEREWGTRRFLRFAAITTLVGFIVGAGLGLLLSGSFATLPITGMGPFVYGALIGYGVAFGDRDVQFFGVLPMKGRTLAIGISVVVVLATVLNRDWLEGAANIAGMLTAVALTSRNLTPRLWILQWRRNRLRKKFKVLGGGSADKKQWLN